MTAQIPEQLHLEGKKRSMCTEPLGNFFTLIGTQPAFAVNNTALWRGYVGTWAIASKRLYLLALAGTLKSGAAANLATVFPGYPDRVFAHWFSGDLRLPEGRLLQYVHGGYASSYERDRIISVRQGVVFVERLKTNGTAPESDADEPGYVLGVMTTFPGTTPMQEDAS